MTAATEKRIGSFVDWFIREDFVRPDLQDLYLSDPERADRLVERAADNGADGSTHREIIDDWRRAFTWYIRDRRRGRWADPDRFIAAVLEHFEALERWHDTNGSLDQEIG